MSLVPPPKAVYPDLPAACTAIQEYTKGSGYTLCRRSSTEARVLVGLLTGWNDRRNHDSMPVI
jgi:hypothetical protein